MKNSATLFAFFCFALAIFALYPPLVSADVSDYESNNETPLDFDEIKTKSKETEKAEAESENEMPSVGSEKNIPEGFDPITPEAEFAYDDDNVNFAPTDEEPGSTNKNVIPPEFLPLTPDIELKAKTEGEKHAFGAEVNRLMKLIINSLYKSKEIFLRELISNASDALDKIRFLSLTDSSLLGDMPDLKITLVIDPDQKTLTITDTGIGMTRENLREHLGTIAKSGTAEFSKNDNSTADAGLIGQFGVGFYSVFLVADSVTVISKNPNDDQYIWESTSENDYTLYKDPRGNTLGRGTQIVIHVKDEAQEFLRTPTIISLTKKYSEFITFPIYIWKEEKVTKEVPNEDYAEEVVTDDEDIDAAPDVEDADAEEKKPKFKTVTETVHSWSQINENRPIWTKSPKDLTVEDYNRFFHKFAKEETDPVTYIHFKGEGDVGFTGLLFMPRSAATRYTYNYDNEKEGNIKLYVRRVMISDDYKGFLPGYLSSISGIVDSDDLPINVSRETLQQHSIIKLIKKKLVAKTLEMFKKLSDDTEKYFDFIKNFSIILKRGILEDTANRKKIQALLRYNSSHSLNITSFDDYISRMRVGQKQIFYLSGQTSEEMMQSPFVEKAITRGYEVLLMTSSIDEFVIQASKSYKDFPFQSVAKEGLKFGDEKDDEEEKKKELNEKFSPLIEWIQKVLKSQAEKVVISDRLVKSPCAVIAGKYGASGMMEKMMKAQKSDEHDTMRDFMFLQLKTFEINPNHPIFISMLEKMDAVDEGMEELVRVLFDASLMRAGYDVPDQKKFFDNIDMIVRRRLNIDFASEAEVKVEPAPEVVSAPTDPAKAEEQDPFINHAEL